MIKLGFIGVGDMGMGQVAAFAELPRRRCQVAAGADVSAEARRRFTEKYPGAAVYADHQQLLADTNVDAVVVAAPTWHHRDIVIAALKSGRPVLTEKPMARTVAHCRQLNDAAAKAGKLLMVAHCRRYDADWGAWGRIVKQGALGGPVLWRHVMAGFGPSAGWFCDDKLGGGPLLDGAVHNHDFANWLFGEPESVLAQSIKLTEATGTDTATAVVRYKSGDQMMLCWSWGTAPGGHLIDVLGPKGTLNWGAGQAAQGQELDPAYGYYHVIDRKNRQPKLYKFKKKNMYVEQARHFLDCIEGKAECLSPGTEAIKAVAVAEAILKAGKKGGVRRVRW